MRRIVLIVLDSVGVGELPDAADFGDEKSNTISNISKVVGGLNIPNLKRMGVGNITDILGAERISSPIASYGKCNERSIGKDTVTGHWEMAGVIIETPLQTYPNGFSKEIMSEFEQKIGRSTIGNVVASGTEIIKELGDTHVKTGFPIIYTSADSVFQIAAHEKVIPLEKLYEMCQTARDMLVGDKIVGRVIARPFIGEKGNYTRTSNRKDYALDPFGKTMLDYIKEDGQNVMAVGKIEDIFNKKGITEAIHIKNNMDGVDKTLEFMKTDKKGIIFTNLVDFDMLYGHRNDVKGYASAIEKFDTRVPEILELLGEDDILIITADHGCDPTTASTDHSREYIPLLVYLRNNKIGTNLGTRSSFTDIGKTVLEILKIKNNLPGVSFYNQII